MAGRRVDHPEWDYIVAARGAGVADALAQIERMIAETNSLWTPASQAGAALQFMTGERRADHLHAVAKTVADGTWPGTCGTALLWDEDDYARALDRFEQLAGELERSHPGAAASLHEGMAETLTLTRLGISGPLTRTLASTNPIESMIECVRRTSRNVKRWQSGEMALRWTAAGMLEAERQFRRIVGYADLAKLALAVERDLAATSFSTTMPTTPREADTLATIS